MVVAINIFRIWPQKPFRVSASSRNKRKNRPGYTLTRYITPIAIGLGNQLKALEIFFRPAGLFNHAL